MIYLEEFLTSRHHKHKATINWRIKKIDKLGKRRHYLSLITVVRAQLKILHWRSFGLLSSVRRWWEKARGLMGSRRHRTGSNVSANMTTRSAKWWFAGKAMKKELAKFINFLQDTVRWLLIVFKNVSNCVCTSTFTQNLLTFWPCYWSLNC